VQKDLMLSQKIRMSKVVSFLCRFVFIIATNGFGLCEVEDLEAFTFNLVPNPAVSGRRF